MYWEVNSAICTFFFFHLTEMDNLIKMSYSTLKNVGRGVILLCFLCYLLLIYFYSSLRSEVADAVFKNVDSSVLVHSKA
jgi:hypothetical protein